MADTQAYVVADIKSSGGTDDGQYATVTYALRDGEEIVLAFPISMIGHYLAIVEGAAKRAIDAAAVKTGVSMSGFPTRVVRAKEVNFGQAPEYSDYLMAVETVQNVTATYEMPRDILESMAKGLPGILSRGPD